MTRLAFHKPVLLNEAVRYLITHPDGIYVDGTLGGGGHSEHILANLGEKARLFALDQDEEAITHAGKRFRGELRITLIRGNFAYLDVLLPKEVHGSINGILLDLGVSSHQIDEAGRGFSFQKEGPLDMRMGSLQLTTAADVVNDYSYEQLRDLFFEYGEERRSARIARAIIDARPIETTTRLRDIVASVLPSIHMNKSLARIFQALRIEVNSELKMLKHIFEKSHSLLRDEGRLVVITYHSLEDRICKNYLRYGNFEGVPVKDFYGHDIRPMTEINRKVIRPGTKEIAENPRARSAKLRVARKLPFDDNLNMIGYPDLNHYYNKGGRA